MVSVDCGPLAPPATSKDTTEQHEDTTEQHKHHFQDSSCRICMGGKETWEGLRDEGPGLGVGFNDNRGSGLGEKCPRLPPKGSVQIPLQSP